MLTVRLLTGNSEFVTEAIIPAFKTLPDALVWGNRTFRLHGIGDGEKATPLYRECFTYWIPPGMEKVMA